jgi:hypothetical protein
VCGATHTCATRWRGRDAKHMLAWRAKHDASCWELFIQQLRQEGQHARADALERQRRAA